MKTHARPATGKAAGKATGRQTTAKAGGCGTGAGGFKKGNTCGCKACGHEDDAPPTQAHPDVHRAHARIAKADRIDHPHGRHVAHILAGKDKDGKLGRANPKAQEDADALRSYQPETGHVAVGLKPGRPDEDTALAISRLTRQQAKGHPLNEHELAAVADRDASHVGVRDGWGDSDRAGHRFLVHDRLSGRNEVRSEADLQSMSRSARAAMRGTDEHPGRYVPVRQFDSQGVEVELHHGQYQRSLDPGYAPRPRAAYRQDPGERKRERAAYKGAKRAQFGSSDPKS